jgi:hypothetical protein
MAKPPPENLMEWSKPALVKELQRLRAIMREHAESITSDNRPEGEPTITDPFGDPYARGNVIFDVRGAVLMDELDVALLDDASSPRPFLALSLRGRINYGTERSETLYLFDEDGAAAIITQLMGLAMRAGKEWLVALEERIDERMKELP